MRIFFLRLSRLTKTSSELSLMQMCFSSCTTPMTLKARNQNRYSRRGFKTFWNCASQKKFTTRSTGPRTWPKYRDIANWHKRITKLQPMMLASPPFLRSRTQKRRDSLQATCRAGAIVLLVGFWFDGGLFKLPVAIVFWTLMELARNSSIGVGQSCGSAPISPSASAAMLAETRAKTSSGSFWRKFGRRGRARSHHMGNTLFSADR